MAEFSTIGLGVCKTQPRGGGDGTNSYRNTVTLRNCGKNASEYSVIL